MAAPKGHKRYGGRQKGTQNKLSMDLRQMILNSLSDVGGETYLRKQADENPTAYLALVSKVLPKEIKADVNVKTAPGMLMILQ